MKHDALRRKQQRRERDARRGRLGKGRFDNLVRELAGLSRLAFQAGAVGSLFGLEGPLRHQIRSDLCLQGWEWKEADDMARELLGMAYMALRAKRPDWDEGQPEWAIATNILIERTRCVRCHAQLPEGHWKFCSDLCKSGHHVRNGAIRRASEDEALRIATTWT